jgi:3-methyl-2-oxobutanoate hydroxymethyltransferase
MSTGTEGREKRVTTRELISMKARGDKIVVLTAYDFLFAGIVDAAGVDVVLVGDSLGHVVLGFDSTIPVTLDDMIRHGGAVRRAVRRALLVVDMPFMSFHVSTEDTLRNAGRILKETEAESVKLEGGDDEAARHVRALVRAGIPVTADRLLEEALRLQDAGAYAVVVELMPADLAGQISRALEIPTIGIGAGPQTDGQVLVLPDMLGLNPGFQPKFLRRFGDLGAAARAAVADYAAAVRSGEYPAPEHSFD